MTFAAASIDECAPSEHASAHPAAGRDRSLAARCRAATSPDRLPAEPPETNVPPAVVGNPARSAIHRSAWFSAQMPPAPSIQAAPIVLEAPTTRSKSTEAFVGAAGTKARFAGWSVEIVAGARISAQIRRASSPPMPPGVTVSPASFVSSSDVIVPSSGCAFAIRSRA